MAAGLCFDGDGGVLELWGGEDYYDPERVTDTFGNVPAEFLDIGFALMDPVANNVTKYVRFYDNMDDEDFVENFARMERWLDEGIDMAGVAYEEFIRDIYQENKLYENELELGGEHVDITNIDMPVLQIVAEYDHLIPPEASAVQRRGLLDRHRDPRVRDGSHRDVRFLAEPRGTLAGGL